MKLGVLALSLAATFAITACSTDQNAIEQSLVSASEAITTSSASEPLVIETVNNSLTTPENVQPASAATNIATPVLTASESDNKETAAPKTPIQTTEAEQAVIK